ncbi:MAG: Holliday junction resolvase RuvX [Candidatus Kapabacteria bacterium]|nr:Holliday junction resolvase RuvX [Candidatus Kapabacteria bacterium]MDW7997702.1 Holliday junction resolvase RuvX [Bacteroidota bacterium]
MAEVVTAEELQGRRLLGIDFGLRRVGWAVCDELHLSVTPGGVLAYDAPQFWETLERIVHTERIEGFVVGVPVGADSPRTKPVVVALREFVLQLRKRFPQPIYVYDETGSTRRAQEAMRLLGVSRKRRQQRGRADRVAAALILWDFLQELHTWGEVQSEELG